MHQHRGRTQLRSRRRGHHRQGFDDAPAGKILRTVGGRGRDRRCKGGLRPALHRGVGDHRDIRQQVRHRRQDHVLRPLLRCGTARFLRHLERGGEHARKLALAQKHFGQRHLRGGASARRDDAVCERKVHCFRRRRQPVPIQLLRQRDLRIAFVRRHGVHAGGDHGGQLRQHADRQ